MRLLAISDLHLGHPANRRALTTIDAHPDDWLIVAGDVGETGEHLSLAFDHLTPRFAKVLWVPGNHELWTVPSDPPGIRGDAKYRMLVELCRKQGVHTPEDPFLVWEGEGGRHRIALLHLLYDYTFRPAHLDPSEAVDWARESGVVCADETYLAPDPFPSRPHWCAARVEQAESRLANEHADLPSVLVNHYPLHRDLAILPRIPRFEVWCGTQRTHGWHRRYAATAVIQGHLHIRATTWKDGTRFEEVSVGYPRQWTKGRRWDTYLRTVLPGSPPPPHGQHFRLNR